nr:MAG TPA: hypothetical protein [Caudoviricetes sp.]
MNIQLACYRWPGCPRLKVPFCSAEAFDASFTLNLNRLRVALIKSWRFCAG